MAGERFCVRNSGVTAVVEGVGDHACEYMTGGRVLVLGRTGRNFGAGMSGGIAWVLDEAGDFEKVLNREMVDQEPLTSPEEFDEVRALLERHVRHTGSALGQRILDGWAAFAPKFVRIVPNDYRRVLEAQARMRAKGLSPEEAEMAAFEENARDEARVGGN
jgi:glutamate synthase (ferredoxin)